MTSPKNSVYQKARANKQIAAYVLVPLIEFEFSFYGSNKPWISQSVKNSAQLHVLYDICSSHGWTTGPIKKFRESELSFKLSNRAFSEIYNLAGPMADDRKDAWAKLLVGRTGKLRYLEKTVISSEDVLSYVSSRKEPISIRELCLALDRLPKSIERHLRILRAKGLVERTEIGFLSSKRVPANSSP